MAKVADLGDLNATFVPLTQTRYFEYAPCSPAALARRGQVRTAAAAWWPVVIHGDYAGIDESGALYDHLHQSLAAGTCPPPCSP